MLNVLISAKQLGGGGDVNFTKQDLHGVQLRALVVWSQCQRAGGLVINGKCIPLPRYQAMKASHLRLQNVLPLVILIEILMIFSDIRKHKGNK
jgi:hypothetical protein